MRIGLSTAEFGSVEVRTSVHDSDVGVQIGSEKGDLRSLLTPELPNIANSLQQQNLHLAQVSFHQQGFSFTGNSSFSGGSPQPRSFARPQTTAIISEEFSATESGQPVVNPYGTGLSILA
jgi:flagellar hook-length control protein FliK